MSLHRLLGFRAAVADPAALAGYYAKLGLTGDASSGYAGSDGGAVVLIDEAPFRRLLSVDVEAWTKELVDMKAFFQKFGPRLPEELWQEHDRLSHRLKLEAA